MAKPAMVSDIMGETLPNDYSFLLPDKKPYSNDMLYGAF